MYAKRRWGNFYLRFLVSLEGLMCIAKKYRQGNRHFPRNSQIAQAVSDSWLSCSRCLEKTVWTEVDFDGGKSRLSSTQFGSIASGLKCYSSIY